jgi:cytoskeleton protein RodZ
LQISVLEIAKELHLDEFKVRAMESNDFEVIGAPVFAKGHLRKYAQLVKVNEADVMADYYRITRSSGLPPALAPRPRQRPPISLGPWIAAIVVILVVASGYWWYANQAGAPEPRVTGQITPSPSPAEVAAVEEGETAPEETGDAEFEELVPISPPVTEAPREVVTDASSMQLSITYVGDCWTEITDASGRRLFFDLGLSGRTINLSGESPFNVLFGDAENVTLEVNGEEFQIPAASRRGKTARLTITGS